MESKDIVRKIIEFDNPPRIGLDFNPPNRKDIAWVMAARLYNRKYAHLTGWGFHQEELAAVPDFNGEVRRDQYGNIFGRLEGRTNGECIKGALQDGWEAFDSFEMPELDESYDAELKEIFKKNEGRFLLGAMPVSVFSTLRDVRRIDNALMDVLLEEEMVVRFLDKVRAFSGKIIDKAAEAGFHGIIFYDDWGTQRELLINPIHWRRLFKPVYAALAEKAHGRDMKFFVHSCGYIYHIINDFIKAGVDVLQLDQPELIGVDRLAEEFGGRVTFWSPVDIQQIMMTGDKQLIVEEARKMIQALGKLGGGFIAKDYPQWEDINVKDEWAGWAREVFISEGWYR